LLEVGHQLIGLSRLDHDVIDVCLNGPPDVVAETLDHAVLVSCPIIFESERHRIIAIRSKQGDEQSRELVLLLHRDLVVPRVRIQKVEGFAP
jgi:hypothetical protein